MEQPNTFPQLLAAYDNLLKGTVYNGELFGCKSL
jgi:hypothetical protein